MGLASVGPVWKGQRSARATAPSRAGRTVSGGARSPRAQPDASGEVARP
jgi:hypothetical protein